MPVFPTSCQEVEKKILYHSQKKKNLTFIFLLNNIFEMYVIENLKVREELYK